MNSFPHKFIRNPLLFLCLSLAFLLAKFEVINFVTDSRQTAYGKTLQANETITNVSIVYNLNTGARNVDSGTVYISCTPSFILNIFLVNPPFKFDLSFIQELVVAKLMVLRYRPVSLCFLCMPMNCDYGNFRHVKAIVFVWVNSRDDQHTQCHVK